MPNAKTRAAMLGLLVILVGWTAGEAADSVPPARPPREKLTLWGKEIYEGRRILLDEDSYPRRAARLIEGPSVQGQRSGFKIRFALDRPDDVLVRVVDAEGKTVRELGCGVLGANAPSPLRPGSLRQEILWDGKDERGRPAPPECKVRVSVGLSPRFERFVAYDPHQILNDVCGLEVDDKGRLYVALFSDRRGDPHLLRYDREGKHLETLYPPNPNSLRGKLEEVYRYCEHLDGTTVPQRVGGPWPYCIYKYHSSEEDDPIRYPFPLRITRSGRAYIGEPRANMIESGMVRAEWDALGALKARVFSVELDPFWFLQGMVMGEGPFVADNRGFGYLCTGETIRKVSLTTVKPEASFEYDGREKLNEKRYTLGTLKRRAGDQHGLFHKILDLTVDDAGNLYVVDGPQLKIFRSNGQLVTTLEHHDLGGRQVSLGPICGVRAAGGALYVVAKVGPSENRRWKRALLVKFKLVSGAAPKAVWSLPLDGRARCVAVDEHARPRLVWVGNGGGAATFTRIADEGDRPGQVRHCGSGVRSGVLIYPWAVAVDGRGRVFAYDRARRRIIRTNDDGSEWLESKRPFHLGTKALHIDRKRGRLFVSEAKRLSCFDLDLNEKRGGGFPIGAATGRPGVNLGALDGDGNLHVSDLRQGSKSRGTEPGLHGVVKKLSPDGRLVQEDFCRTFLPDGGLAMDRAGCLYVTDTCRMGFMDAVHNWAIGRGVKWKRGKKVIRGQSDLAYLVKFPPGGGQRGTDTELWAHRGVSPVMGGGCQCPIATNCVAIDSADRIFAADYIMYHAKVLDTAGNLIARIGNWGSADCRGPKSTYPKPEIAVSWLHSMDAFGDALYASDRDLRRIVKVRMDYREVREATVP